MSFQLVNLNTETVDHCHPAEPLCLAPDTSMREVLGAMRRHNRGAVLVCEAEKIIGIFTERDALKMMAARASLDAPLRQCMTADPIVLRAGERVSEAISKMSKGGYRRLPIVDQRGRPSGIVTAEGIMHYLVEHFPSVIYNLPPEPHYYCAQQREGA